MTREADKRNFISHPCFKELVAAINEQIRKETAGLTQMARDGDVTKINVQAGIVEGLERTALRLRSLVKEMLKPAPSAKLQAQKLHEDA
jgi:hypothetical protein